MKISIIIVNYNTEAYIIPCIESILKYSAGVDFEIIVVDNASPDNSSVTIRNKFPEVILIDSKENLGFGRANNLGCKYATGELLFFLNPDTLFTSNALQDFLNYYLVNENIGCLGANLIQPDGRMNTSYGAFPTLREAIFTLSGLRYVFKRYFKHRLSGAQQCDFTEPKKVEYIIGADIFMSKQVFEEVNGFDEDFFMYYEETELCFKLKEKQLDCIVLPHIKIVHYEGVSSKQEGGLFNYNKYAVSEHSRYLFFRKCYGPIFVYAAKLLSVPLAAYQFIKNRGRVNPFKLLKLTWLA